MSVLTALLIVLPPFQAPGAPRALDPSLPMHPRRVADLDRDVAQVASSDPREFVQVGGTTFLVATTSRYGTELYRSDGTPAGTVLVRDLVPGPGSSDPRELCALGDTLLFFADGKLWASDGTAEGTVAIGSSAGSGLTVVGGTAYFGVHRSTPGGGELWKSDGTASGTRIVYADFGPFAPAPEGFTEVQGEVYFAAGGSVLGVELWKTDGTASGTVLVADVNADNDPDQPGSSPESLVEFAGQLFFAARPDAHTGVNRLYKSDGTAAGTVLVSGAPANPSELTVLGSYLFFSSSTGLWRSDGTTSGTTPWGPGGSGLVVAGTKLFYTAYQPSTSGAELWVVDDPNAPPHLVLDIVPGVGSSSPQYVTAVGPEVAFQATTPGEGAELWRSDGTAAGTFLVADIQPGGGGSAPGPFGASANATVLFSADGGGAAGRELWFSDGTAAGTRIVADIDPMNVTADSDPRGLVSWRGRAVFLAGDTGSEDLALYASDGRASATVRIAGGFLETTPALDPQFTELGDALLFAAGTPATGIELWRTDGTSGGTYELSEIVPGAAGSNPFGLTRFDGAVWFRATHPTNGFSLFRSDGTTGGTTLADPLSPGVSPVGFAVAGGRLFFSGYEPATGRELWVTDGTLGGTTLLSDIRVGPASSDPDELVAVGNRLFFTAVTDSEGKELWTSDGTPSGTVRVADIRAGAGGSSPADLTPFQGGVVFAADDGLHGRELWWSDGTPGGTFQVSDIAPGGSSNPYEFTRFDSRIYFRANEGFATTGIELWTSDGTSAGTRLVADLSPGPASSTPLEFTLAGGRLWFTAVSGTDGRELWVSDGTAAGTRRVENPTPDRVPTELTTAGAFLFFSGADEWAGREPFAVPVGPIPARRSP